jgi:adenosine deaminase
LLQFINAGVKVTVNTDNMTVSDTDIRSEYRMLEKTLGMDMKIVRQLLENAVEAAFASEEIKLKLQKKIEKNF